MLAGFSSVWLAGELPCFISHCSRYIIIFDLEGALPFWFPYLEESSEFVGTFEFWHNRFRERCGVYIDDCGKVCITVKPPSNYRKERGKATASAQSMRPRPNNEVNPNGGGVTISPRGCVAPNVDDKTLPAQDQQAAGKAVDEVEDENFHSPREVEED